MPDGVRLAKEHTMTKPASSSHLLIANSASQQLDQHSFAVGYLAFHLVQTLTGKKNVAIAAFIAGCFHDLGKIDPQFQNSRNQQ